MGRLLVSVAGKHRHRRIEREYCRIPDIANGRCYHNIERGVRIPGLPCVGEHRLEPSYAVIRGTSRLSRATRVQLDLYLGIRRHLGTEGPQLHSRRGFACLGKALGYRLVGHLEFDLMHCHVLAVCCRAARVCVLDVNFHCLRWYLASRIVRLKTT